MTTLRLIRESVHPNQDGDGYRTHLEGDSPYFTRCGRDRAPAHERYPTVTTDLTLVTCKSCLRCYRSKEM